MKKICILFAALITMLISCASPLITAFAYDLENNYVTFDSWLTEFHTNNSYKYIVVQFSYVNSNRTYYDTVGFSINNNNISSVSNENNVYTVNFTGSIYIQGWESPTFSWQEYSCSRDYSMGTATGFVLDLDNNTFRFIDGTIYTGTFTINDYITNIDELLNNGEDIYNVEVLFTPILSGNVDRKINGMVSSELQMDVFNHSLFDIQYLLAIVPTGGSVHFYESGIDSDYDVGQVTNSPNGEEYNFIWWSDEWNYMYDSGITTEANAVHAHHANYSEVFTSSKQFGPCPWHFVASNGAVSQKFTWSQIDLTEYQTYDVLVYALRTDCGAVSRQSAYSTADNYVDYSQIQLVYNSTFTLTNGYKYDQNDNSNGVYAYASGSNKKGSNYYYGWSSKGHIDPETGETVIELKEPKDYLQAQSQILNDWNLNYSIADDVVIDSNASSVPASLKNNVNSFLSFVTYVFGKLPSDIKSIYLYGLVALVALGIIMKVIK